MFATLLASRSRRWLTGASIVLLAALGTNDAHGQMLLDLRIEGPPAVLENGSADYTAIATFDDGNEYEVTLLCDWSLIPGDYASITQFGRLTTEEVTEDQDIIVHAVFTWEDVTEEASRDVTIVDVTEDEGADPWPEYQRTASRLGRTSTIGPQTPRVEWSIQFAPTSEEALVGSPVMDAAGRIFVPFIAGITCIDSHTRAVLWQFQAGPSILETPVLHEGRVLFGGFEYFRCLDAATGDQIWAMPTPALTRGTVADPDAGTVCFPSDTDQLHAWLIEDGSEVWTELSADVSSAPSLDPLFRVVVGAFVATRSHATGDGATIWDAPLGSGLGVRPIDNGRVYSSGQGQPLYCLDANTGEVIWANCLGSP